MDERTANSKGDVIEQLHERLRKFAGERDWNQFNTPRNLAMALSVEAGELLEHFQWLTPEQSETLSESDLAKEKST